METTNVCQRHCVSCNLQPSLEAKQICASFKAIEMLSFIEKRVISNEKELMELKNNSKPDNSEIAFNMDVLAPDNKISISSETELE